GPGGRRRRAPDQALVVVDGHAADPHLVLGRAAVDDAVARQPVQQRDDGAREWVVEGLELVDRGLQVARRLEPGAQGAHSIPWLVVPAGPRGAGHIVSQRSEGCARPGARVTGPAPSAGPGAAAPHRAPAAPRAPPRPASPAA